MKLRTVLTTLAVLGLAACATVPPAMQATGGSKSDGTIEMTHEFSLYGPKEVDTVAGERIALERCEQWGYSGVESFSPLQRCISNRNGFGQCFVTQVTTKYQCVD